MIITHTSDTHTLPFEHLVLNGATEVFIHSGDATFIGAPWELHNLFSQLNEVAEKVPHVIYVPGNHDLTFEDDGHNNVVLRALSKVPLKDNVHILIEKALEIEGVKFYGHPYTPEFMGWGFGYPRNSVEAGCIYERIPKDTDVLITHGPPFGILDRILEGDNVGCEVYESYLGKLLNLKLCCFGHIHEAYGIVEKDGTLFSNAAHLDRQYDREQLRESLSYKLENGKIEPL